MEGNGAFWVQVVASAGVLTPLVLGILGFIERRSKQAKDAEEANGEPETIRAGVRIDPANDPVSILRERVTTLEQTVRWIAEERDYFYVEAVKAGARVEPPRIKYT